MGMEGFSLPACLRKTAQQNGRGNTHTYTQKLMKTVGCVSRWNDDKMQKLLLVCGHSLVWVFQQATYPSAFPCGRMRENPRTDCTLPRCAHSVHGLCSCHAYIRWLALCCWMLDYPAKVLAIWVKRYWNAKDGFFARVCGRNPNVGSTESRGDVRPDNHAFMDGVSLLLFGCTVVWAARFMPVTCSCVCLCRFEWTLLCMRHWSFVVPQTANLQRVRNVLAMYGCCTFVALWVTSTCVTLFRQPVVVQLYSAHMYYTTHTHETLPYNICDVRM